jgi:hypothetical protein
VVTHFSAKQSFPARPGLSSIRGPPTRAADTGATLAHPLIEAADLPVSPLLAAIGAAAIVDPAAEWWPTSPVGLALAVAME